MVFILVLFFAMCVFLFSGNRAASINPVVAHAKVDSKASDLPTCVIAKGEFVSADRIHKGFFANDCRVFGYNSDGDFLSQGVI